MTVLNSALHLCRHGALPDQGVSYSRVSRLLSFGRSPERQMAGPSENQTWSIEIGDLEEFSSAAARRSRNMLTGSTLLLTAADQVDDKFGRAGMFVMGWLVSCSPR